MVEPTLEEITQLEINYDRGFYCDIRNGKIHAGRDPAIATEVF